MNREKLIKILSDYFNLKDTYAFNLTRVKINYNELTVDDFEEFDETTIKDIANYIVKNLGDE